MSQFRWLSKCVWVRFDLQWLAIAEVCNYGKSFSEMRYICIFVGSHLRSTAIFIMKVKGMSPHLNNNCTSHFTFLNQLICSNRTESLGSKRPIGGFHIPPLPLLVWQKLMQMEIRARIPQASQWNPAEMKRFINTGPHKTVCASPVKMSSAV